MAGSMIITLTSQGEVSLVNKKGCEFLEANEKEIFGKNWFETFLFTEDVASVKVYFDNLMQGKLKLARYAENNIKTAKGNIRLIAWHNTLIKEDEKIIGILSSGTDITQQKEHEHSIIEAKKVADRANQSKSDFLASMSHEIRTPMTGMLGFIGCLLKDEEDTKRIKQLQVVENSGKTLLAIINDILDFSMIESGKLEFDSAPYNLNDLFGNTLDIFATLSSSKNISMHKIIDENLPSCVMGDETRLKQVVFNLIDFFHNPKRIKNCYL